VADPADPDGQTLLFHYSVLLAVALPAITCRAEKIGVDRLVRRGGTVLGKASFQGIDDFEVVAYPVILGKEAAT